MDIQYQWCFESSTDLGLLQDGSESGVQNVWAIRHIRSRGGTHEVVLVAVEEELVVPTRRQNHDRPVTSAPAICGPRWRKGLALGDARGKSPVRHVIQANSK
jgi:hypothetical protein